MDQPAINRLPIVEILKLAAKQVWLNREALVQGCAVPVAIIALTRFPWLIPWFGTPIGILLALPQLVASLLFTMTCHRILMLGESSIPNKWGVYFTKREVRYGAYSLLIVLLVLGFVGGQFVLMYALGPVGLVLLIPISLSVFIFAYLHARIFMLFPGLAVDQAWTLQACWSLTRVHAWRLLALFLLSGVLASIPSFVLIPMAARVSTLLGWLVSIPLHFVGLFPVAVLSYAFIYVCPEHLRPIMNERPSRLSEGETPA
jgi:hypothetical protein